MVATAGVPVVGAPEVAPGVVPAQYSYLIIPPAEVFQELFRDERCFFINHGSGRNVDHLRQFLYPTSW